MNISFTPRAWDDYQYWMSQNKKKRSETPIDLSSPRTTSYCCKI
jgi:Txe/YoeB family toxin of Txe-Axe toxin-antitoxin module